MVNPTMRMGCPLSYTVAGRRRRKPLLIGPRTSMAPAPQRVDEIHMETPSTTAGTSHCIVGDIMTRHVLCVRMDDTLATVRELFERHQMHHLLVLESGRLVGVISDRDLLKNLSPFVGKALSERPQDLATLHRRVHQIMTRKLVSTTPDTPIGNAAELMLAHRISCLPVVNEQGKPIGIVTWRDLLRAMVSTATTTAATAA
jgi:acetoin utilization protein AcuB